MSKFTEATSTSHTLSLAAMEEASRVGQRTANIYHLFLALTVNEQDAGQVLRSLGITLEAARNAVSAQHAAQLATIGIESPASVPGNIVFHETVGYEWDERVIALMKRAGRGANRGDAAAVLRELLAERSGMIEAILCRLGSTSTAVIAELDEMGRYPVHKSRSAVRAGNRSGVSESFAPALPEQVWDLLATPSRMPDWKPSIGSVAHLPQSPRTGDSWTALTRTERHDGKAIRVKPAFKRQEIALVRLEEPHRIEWRFSYPDAPGANSYRISVELEPAAGGTHVRLTLSLERDASRSRRLLLGFIMRPIRRFVLWMQLSQLSSGISREFR